METENNMSDVDVPTKGTNSHECLYSTDIDADLGIHSDYSCPRSRVSESNFCMFHDEKYFESHKEEIKQKFISEIYSISKNPSPLYYVGCHIPLVDLPNLTINAPIYFVKTEFHDTVTFSNLTINAPIYFVKTEFHDTVTFSRVQFSTVNFNEAKFHKHLELMFVNVSDTLFFKKTKFLDGDSQTKFEYCGFKNSIFSLSTFNILSIKHSDFNLTVFRSTKFNNNSLFSYCHFNDTVDFSNSEFLNEISFFDTTFHKNTIFRYAQFNSISKFHRVDFKEQRLVVFDGRLSNVSFLNSDITRVKFENVTWGSNDTYTVYDDDVLSKNPDNVSLSHVLALYRNLRENYEFHLMYAEAGQFFVREMNLRRKYHEAAGDNKTKTNGRLRQWFSLISWYCILCNYGESLKRISICIFVLFGSVTAIFVIFPDVIYLEQSKPLGDIDYLYKIENDLIFRIETALNRTTSMLLQISDTGLLDHAIRIIFFLLFGIVFLVLRRRFERRFRH